LNRLSPGTPVARAIVPSFIILEKGFLLDTNLA
jgi:hypothetical protein